MKVLKIGTTIPYYDESYRIERVIAIDYDGVVTYEGVSSTSGLRRTLRYSISDDAAIPDTVDAIPLWYYKFNKDNQFVEEKCWGLRIPKSSRCPYDRTMIFGPTYRTVAFELEVMTKDERLYLLSQNLIKAKTIFEKFYRDKFVRHMSEADDCAARIKILWPEEAGETKEG